MTLLFENYIRSVLLETEFRDLIGGPVPYGFWIFPNGKIEKVDFLGHSQIAENLTKGIPYLKKKYEDYIRSEQYMFHTTNYHMFFKNFLNCARLVIPQSKDAIYVDLNSNDPNDRRTFIQELTSKQKQTIKDLSQLYNIDIKYLRAR